MPSETAQVEVVERARASPTTSAAWWLWLALTAVGQVGLPTQRRVKEKGQKFDPRFPIIPGPELNWQ